MNAEAHKPPDHSEASAARGEKCNWRASKNVLSKRQLDGSLMPVEEIVGLRKNLTLAIKSICTTRRDHIRSKAHRKRYGTYKCALPVAIDQNLFSHSDAGWKCIWHCACIG